MSIGNVTPVMNKLLDVFDGQVLTTGNVFYVDSGATLAGDNPNRGLKKEAPFATIDYAIDKCTPNNGDIIYALPGHVDDLAAAATIDLDVAGVSLIGLGRGPDRPRIDFNGTTASIDVGANGCTIQNIQLRPSVATVAIGIDIEAGVTDTLLKDIEFVPGEEGDGTDEFVIGVDIKAGCTRTEIDGFRYSHHASANGAATAIKFTGASDRCRVANFWIEGSGTAWVAGINGITTLSTRLLFEEGVITCDAEPGIEMLTGTTGSIKNVSIFTNLATIDAATVADGMAHFDVKYVEVGNEAGTLVKTESVDD